MVRRTVEQVIADAERLAAQFEQWEPDPAQLEDGAPIRVVHQAFQRAALAQRELSEAVAVARGSGFSWAHIGSMMGTTGEAARQRYGRTPTEPPASEAAEPEAAEPSAVERRGAGRLAG